MGWGGVILAATLCCASASPLPMYRVFLFSRFMKSLKEYEKARSWTRVVNYAKNNDTEKLQEIKR